MCYYSLDSKNEGKSGENIEKVEESYRHSETRIDEAMFADIMMEIEEMIQNELQLEPFYDDEFDSYDVEVPDDSEIICPLCRFTGKQLLRVKRIMI